MRAFSTSRGLLACALGTLLAACPDTPPALGPDAAPTLDASSPALDAAPAAADASVQPGPDATAPAPDAAQPPPDAAAPGLDASLPQPPDSGPSGCAVVDCPADCAVYVDLSVAAPGDGRSPAGAVTSVQAGIDLAAAAAGECCTCEVRVAAGTYGIYQQSPDDTVQLRPRVQVLGGFPAGFGSDRDPAANVTVLDGRQAPASDGGAQTRVFHVVTGADQALLDGFTVTGGAATAGSSLFDTRNYGGALVLVGTSPRLVQCLFTGNSALYGGAVYAFGSAAQFTDCVFEANSATEGGGAMDVRHSSLAVIGGRFTNNTAVRGGALLNGAMSSATFTEVAFEDNSATDRGGAVHNQGKAAPKLTRCVLTGNSAPNGGAVDDDDASLSTFDSCTFDGNTATNGGAVFATNASAPTYVGCTFTANHGNQGAAAMSQASAPVFDRCTFTDNVSNQHGGALVFAAGSTAVLSNSLVTRNTGAQSGALFIDASTPSIVGSTLWGNTGQVMLWITSSNPVITNSIIWHDLDVPVAKPRLTLTGGSKPVITHSAVQGGCTVASGCTTDETGNTDVDPMLIDPKNLDFRLFQFSPLVDRGDASALPATALSGDLSGASRVVDGDRDGTDTVDIGAFEAPAAPYQVLYVDPAATGTADGSTWADAFTTLNAAFDAATPGTHLYIAKGTYQPVTVNDFGTAVTIPGGVALLGGFDPAGGDTTLSQRDPAKSPVVLSGDLNGDGDFYKMTDVLDLLQTTAFTPLHVDGLTFTLVASKALIGNKSALSVSNCRFVKLSGGLYGAFTSVLVRGSSFQDSTNGSGQYGVSVSATVSADFVADSFTNNKLGFSPLNLRAPPAQLAPPRMKVSSCTFENNTSYSEGGAITAFSVPFEVEGCAFRYNSTALPAGLATQALGGGAIRALNAPATIRNNVFDHNTARAEYTEATMPFCTDTYEGVKARGVGGAIFSYGAALDVSDCSFLDNDAVYAGNAPCAVSDTEVVFGSGGAIFAQNGTVNVQRSLFQRNRARITGSGSLAGQGGAIYVGGASSTNLTHLYVDDNSADCGTSIGAFSCSGGGLFLDRTSGIVANSVLRMNTAKNDGGGLHIPPRTYVYNCTIVANSASTGGGASAYGGTYANGTGQDATGGFLNCIFWNNAASTNPAIRVASGNQGFVCFSNVQGGCPSNMSCCSENKSTDPLFASDGLHLTAASPGIDLGRCYIYDPGPVDLDGNPRFVDGNGNGVADIDAGAYEFQP
ncbi:MAG: hypothetical protein QM765_27025 [Myxococcales bacterium]